MARMIACLILQVFIGLSLGSERLGFDRSPPASQWTPGAIERLRAAPDDFFASTMAKADEALKQLPRAMPSIIYEGRLPHYPARVASIETLREVSWVRACFIAWLRSGDERYAERAWAGIMAWVHTYRIDGNAINENKLSSLASAWGMLRDRASDDQRHAADAWFRQLAQAQIDISTSGRVPVSNNWHTKRLRLVALIGVPLEDEDFLRWSREGLASFQQRSISEDGESYDFRERDSLGYHCGMLAPLLEILVALGEPELYEQRAEQGGSAKDAVRFLLPYARGDKEHAEWVNSRVAIDRRRAEAGVERYQPGRIWERHRGDKALGLAAAFEPELAPLAEELSRKAGTWPDLDALLVAVRPWEE